MKGSDAVSSRYAGGGTFAPARERQMEDGFTSHLEVVNFIYLRRVLANIRLRAD